MKERFFAYFEIVSNLFYIAICSNASSLFSGYPPRLDSAAAVKRRDVCFNLICLCAASVCVCVFYRIKRSPGQENTRTPSSLCVSVRLPGFRFRSPVTVFSSRPNLSPSDIFKKAKTTRGLYCKRWHQWYCLCCWLPRFK